MSTQAANAPSVKRRNIRNQLDPSRDFAEPGTPATRYVICCTHRSGSNLLSEALYRTGLAGDPMEYLNRGFLQEYARDAGTWNFTFADFMADMQARRTSPNGVFGLNVKFDQMQIMFRRVPNPLVRMLQRADYVLFLYREDRVQQAVSTWKGQKRDTFNVYAEEQDETNDEEMQPSQADEVPFDPLAISQRLTNILRMERQWQQLFQNQGIDVDHLTYEQLVADYRGSVRHILKQLGIEAGENDIPAPPTVKMRDNTDANLRQQFLAHVGAG